MKKKSKFKQAAVMWIRDGVLINRMPINAVAFAYAYFLSAPPAEQESLRLADLVNFAFAQSGISCLEKMTLRRSRLDATLHLIKTSVELSTKPSIAFLIEPVLELATDEPVAPDFDFEAAVRLYNALATEAACSASYFDRAIEIDPNYADGYAGLADSYRLLGMYYVILPVEAYPKAKEAALRALELDPANAVARVSLGTIKFRYEWNWEGAEQEFLRAIEINPSLGIAHHDYAWFLVAMERFDEGIEHMKVAQRLDPLSPLANSDVGWVYLMARRYDEAVDQINRTLELEPAFGGALACLERAYTLKGQHREALETLLREIGDRGGPGSAGDPAQSMKSLYRTRLERRLEATGNERSSPYSIATMCVAAEERDKACEWLARAFTERDPMLVGARTDPAFDFLRGDERFELLLRQIGFSR